MELVIAALVGMADAGKRFVGRRRPVGSDAPEQRVRPVSGVGRLWRVEADDGVAEAPQGVGELAGVDGFDEPSARRGWTASVGT